MNRRILEKEYSKKNEPLSLNYQRRKKIEVFKKISVT
jgi:hypothetical protein